MWEAAFYCDDMNCGKSLTYEQVYQSHGVCPYCGMSSGSEMVGHRVVSEEIVCPGGHHDLCPGGLRFSGNTFVPCQCKCHSEKKHVPMQEMGELGLVFDKKSVEPFELYADMPWWQRMRKALGLD